MVILDIKDYIDIGNRQLNDTSNYKHLEFDPTYWNNKVRNKQLKKWNLFTSKKANSLLEEKTETPKFHLLPKIHKPNDPGRPVISSDNCHTSTTSEFVEYYLQPEVKNLNPMLKTLRILLRKLKQ